MQPFKACVRAQEDAPKIVLAIGMADATMIKRQQDSYAQMLDQQLEHCMKVLNARVSQQKEHVEVKAVQQRAQFIMQVDMEARVQQRRAVSELQVAAESRGTNVAEKNRTQ